MLWKTHSFPGLLCSAYQIEIIPLSCLLSISVILETHFQVSLLLAFQGGNSSHICIHADTLLKSTPPQKVRIAPQCLNAECPVMLLCFPTHIPCSFQHITLHLVSCGARRPYLSFFALKSHFRNCLPGPKITAHAWVSLPGEEKHLEQSSPPSFTSDKSQEAVSRYGLVCRLFHASSEAVRFLLRRHAASISLQGSGAEGWRWGIATHSATVSEPLVNVLPQIVWQRWAVPPLLTRTSKAECELP